MYGADRLRWVFQIRFPEANPLGNRVDARDVLDPDAKTARGFRGRVVGHYRPCGPNPWDDYTFVVEDQGIIDVLPGLKIQLEQRGARFRMRRQGKVVRVEWEPSDRDLEKLSVDDIRERRRLFLAEYVESFDEAQGQAAAVIARKLDS